MTHNQAVRRRDTDHYQQVPRVTSVGIVQPAPSSLRGVVPQTAKIRQYRETSQAPSPAPILIPRKARPNRGRYEEYSQKGECCCCWGLWVLLVLLLFFGAVAGLLYFYWGDLVHAIQKENDVQNRNQDKVREINTAQKVVPGPVKNQSEFIKPADKDDKPKQDLNKEESNAKKEEASVKKEQKEQIEQPQTRPPLAPPETEEEKSAVNITDNGEKTELKSGDNSVATPSSVEDKDQTTKVTVTSITCKPGFFLHKNRCLSCPSDSHWNGKTCVRKTIEKPPVLVPSQTPNKESKATAQEHKPEEPKVQSKPVPPKIDVKDAWQVVKPRQSSSNDLNLYVLSAASNQIKPVEVKSQETKGKTENSPKQPGHLRHSL